MIRSQDITILHTRIRKNCGCVTQLLNTVFDVVNFYDNNLLVDITVLAFSKAFDVVSNNQLILKLSAIGVHRTTCDWVSSWLTDRKLFVTANNNHSSQRSVTSGVAQGSVLGPLLFLIYITDMPSHISTSYLKLFADDSLLNRPINNPIDITILQNDLDSLVSWSEESQVNLNVNKCKHMRISRQPQPSPSNLHHMSSQSISSANEVKYLGITIVDMLSFVVNN